MSERFLVGLRGLGHSTMRTENPRLGRSIHSDLAISPAVEGIGIMAWEMFPRMRELGRRATREALEANPAMAERLRA